MAGGVAAIWGNLDGSGEYDNKEALKCFSVFWNDKNRFTPEMKVDTTFTDVYFLTDSSRYAFYKENTDQINYQLSGGQERRDSSRYQKSIPGGKVGNQRSLETSF